MAAGGTVENPELSTVGDGLGVMAGTSVATAKVTAAAAQVWATNPELSYRQVMEILQSTATDLQSPGWDQETGAGLLNLAAAVQLAKVMTPETVVNPKAPSFQPPPAPPIGSDPTTPTERPTNAAVLDTSGFGLPRVVQVVSQSLSSSGATVRSVGLSALRGLIALGGTVVSTPVAITAIGVASVVALGVVGKAYYDLKQVEAEAAANTAVESWCNLNRIQCAQLQGFSSVQLWTASSSPWANNQVLNGGTIFNAPIEGLDLRLEITGYSGSTPYRQWRIYRGFTFVQNSSYEFNQNGCLCMPVAAPQFRPVGGALPTNWQGASAGVQQAVLDSGVLIAALAQKAMIAGVKGILDSIALPSGLTVLGAGNTAGVIDTANISPYTKDC